MKSVGDDLGGSEGAAGLGLPVLLRGPVPLANNKPKLGGPRLPLPLLDVRPSHPLLPGPERAVVPGVVQLQPILDAGVCGHPGLQPVPRAVQAGQFFLLIQNFPFTGPKEGRIFRCLMSEWLRLKHIFVHRIHIMFIAVYIIRVDFTNLVIIVQ